MVERRVGVLGRARALIASGLAVRFVPARWRPGGLLALAIGCAALAAAEAWRTELVPERGRYQFRDLLEPLKQDLPTLGIGAGEVLGYRDDFMHAPQGNLRYFHLTRLFLAPVLLELSPAREWQLVVRVEKPPPDFERADFEVVKRYTGMNLWRRREDGRGAPEGAR